MIVITSALLVSSTGTPVKLKFTALDGRQVDLETMRGKVVLIDCWATWCGPCIKEMPHLRDLYNRYHDKGFEVIGISLDELSAKGRVLQIIRENDLLWPQRFEGKGFNDDSFRKKYDIKSLPAVYLLDQQGEIVNTDARGKNLEALIKNILRSEY